MKKSFEIESDCLDVIERIKEIDKDYFVVFNLDKRKFELHNRSQWKNSYCLTFPFDTLDVRCLDYVKKTSAKNAEALFAEMEIENEILRKRQCKQVLNDFEEKLYES